MTAPGHGPISYSLVTAAEATGLSQSHLRRAINTGVLRAKRSSVREDDGEPVGKFLIRAVDLGAYIDNLPDW